MPAILIIPAVAILALYGVGGHWIRVAGLFIGILVVVVGIGEIFIFGYFLTQYSTAEWSFIVWGLVMVAAGVLTLFSVRHGSSRLSL